MNSFLKRTWAEICLDNLYYNIQLIKKKLPSKTKIIAVVKADAYGHGDKHIAHSLANYGIDFFAVSNLDEAISLRKCGITQEILILGYTPINEIGTLSDYAITQTVFDYEYAKSISAHCIANGITINAHIKIDTGMGRLGLVCNKNVCCTDEVIKITQLNGINLTGIYSHFSSADMYDNSSIEYTKMQSQLFNSLIENLEEKDVEFDCVHLSNSAGIAMYNNDKYTHARAGLAMFGYCPFGNISDFKLKPVMQIKSTVSMIKQVEANTAISYGRNYITPLAKKVATIPIGYADGYPRLLSNKAYILIKGESAKILGNICMDQMIVDVSEIENIKIGDEVTIVGTDNHKHIYFDELALIIGTISYELMCAVSKRVPRVYVQNGNIIAAENYVRHD